MYEAQFSTLHFLGGGSPRNFDVEVLSPGTSECSEDRVFSRGSYVKAWSDCALSKGELGYRDTHTGKTM